MDLTKKRKLDENGGLLVDSDFGSNKLAVEDIRKIIEPFTHEQLLEIVQNAAVRHLDVLDATRSIADRDPAQRKLFIRGLGWDTTTENLRSLFSAYGELDEAIVILDKATGKSKGFGFIIFRHIDGALLALKEPSKKIDGRMTVTQLASVGSTGSTANLPAMDVSARKIYVGNVPFDMPAERLLGHFSSYGEIEEGPLGFDKATGKFKGYALFVYKTADAARASLVDPIKNIDGHQLNCKLANDGKRGKPGAAVAAGPGGAQPLQGPNGIPAGVPAEPHGNGHGMQGWAGGPNGISSYGAFSGGLRGPSPLSHHPMNSSMGGGPGLSLVGGQAPSSLGPSGGYSGPYGVSHFGGPGLAGYGGAGAGLGGVAGGPLGGAGTGFGGSGRGSSLYGLPPSSAGIPSGVYPESAHYSLSSSGFQSQPHQMEGPSPAPRIPTGGMLHGGPPYY